MDRSAPRTCPHCVTSFVPKLRRGPVPTYCSQVCQVRAKKRAELERKMVERIAGRAGITCQTCGVSLAARRAAKFCSKRCSDIARGMIRATPLPERECALPTCETRFTPNQETTRCCSEKHGKALYNLEHPSPIEARRERYMRRRALKKGAATGLPVRREEIAERDGWTCHLCDEPVPQEAAWPDPLSPSLDHVIPLSRGGIHDPSNVRLAHLSCNVAKGNRVEEVAA